jgi:hypothetical protein
MHVRIVDLRVVGREPQPAGRQDLGQQLVQPRFVQRHHARGQRLDLGDVEVDRDDRMAQLGRAGGMNDPEIARLPGPHLTLCCRTQGSALKHE